MFSEGALDRKQHKKGSSKLSRFFCWSETSLWTMTHFRGNKKKKACDEGEKSNKCLREINLNFRMSCQKASKTFFLPPQRLALLSVSNIFSLFSVTLLFDAKNEDKNCICESNSKITKHTANIKTLKSILFSEIFSSLFQYNFFTFQVHGKEYFCWQLKTVA